jgi:hypothetical protein
MTFEDMSFLFHLIPHKRKGQAVESKVSNSHDRLALHFSNYFSIENADA